MKQKFDFPIGEKVRGYGCLNEYGEFDFYPEQKGKRAGQIKLIKETNDYTLSSSKKRVLVYIRLMKGDRMNMVKDLLKVVDELLKDLNTYEF